MRDGPNLDIHDLNKRVEKRLFDLRLDPVSEGWAKSRHS